jgi:hypothetical protein
VKPLLPFSLQFISLAVALTCLPQSGLCRNGLRLSNGATLAPRDEALLSGKGKHNDLDCSVESVKPEMKLDLRFHSGYVAEIPLKQIAGNGTELRTTVRVTPIADAGNSVVFTDTVTAPAIARGTGGSVDLGGEYVVGPGRYRVDWLIRDGAGHACSAHWKIETKIHHGMEKLPFPVPADTAEEAPIDAFQSAETNKRDPHLLHAKVLVNFSPGPQSEPVLSDAEILSLTSILRAVVRQPQFADFSVVGFSMDEEQVFYRQDPSPAIDFPAMGKAAQALKPGTLRAALLGDPASAGKFLGNLLRTELYQQQPAPDVVIVISPKVMLDKKVPEELLGSDTAARCPIFYLNYDPDPRLNPWRGALGTALKAYGADEYSITHAEDLGSALRDMESKTARDSAAAMPRE